MTVKEVKIKSDIIFTNLSFGENNNNNKKYSMVDVVLFNI